MLVSIRQGLYFVLSYNRSSTSDPGSSSADIFRPQCLSVNRPQKHYSVGSLPCKPDEISVEVQITGKTQIQRRACHNMRLEDVQGRLFDIVLKVSDLGGLINASISKFHHPHKDNVMLDVDHHKRLKVPL
jgi:hypothetical protein